MDKEFHIQQARRAAQKAVEYLEMRATGAAKHELQNALAAIEKVLQ
jgi:hypothetical protein